MSEDGPQKSELAKREEEILAFWEREHIFEKSLKKDAPKGEFVFYDGPPFATGTPHYGHLLQSFIKDAIPRYRTMQGYRVPRRWGWDCHGLPLENQIEQELGLKNKRAIEELGVDKFNEAARSAVMRYEHEWKKVIPRIGRWVDMENDYKTMDPTYTDSVWWSFKTLFDRGLIYEGYKAMQLCPRCGTTLSNFEVAMGYKDIEDYAVYVRFPLVGEKNTSLVIWTTTPWTLPGNMAAAVNADAQYVKLKVGDEFLIVARDRMSAIGGEPVIVEEMQGKALVGKSYEPPFPYFKEKLGKGRTKAFKVYAAPYVTMNDGTGVVHLAPAFGAEDMELAQKEGIPLTHHVDLEGKFTADVTDFVGLPVKPKGDHRKTDALIVDALKTSGRLYKEETITHSYPHCWRCDTPLLNYATSSWFVSVAKLRSKLVSENAKVHWVPEHVGKGRFHNGLSSAPDWAISRSRYWGAPLPVWKGKKTGKMRVFGGIGELLGSVKRSGNTYLVMRHGEAKSNVESYVDSGEDKTNHLTEKGKDGVRASAEALKKKGIDTIVVSPVLRTRETAEIVRETLGLPANAVMVDERLREIEFGKYSGQPHANWLKLFSSYFDRLHRKEDNAETLIDIRRRVGDFLFDIERRYTGKTVLIVTHGEPGWVLEQVAACESCRSFAPKEKPYHEQGAYLENAQVREISFTPFPHNKDFELDYHRPYIDEVSFVDRSGEEYARVPDVFDCWYESGSMPYASNHYPSENLNTFNPKAGLFSRARGYPADFIAESIDQTRGWFYSLVVLGVGLFGKAPYKNVITNGLVLAEDGRKMSKKLKNYPDPMDMVNRYGADALRYYLLSAPIMRGEDLNFAERSVDEVAKKLLMRLDNVRSFYALYQDGTQRAKGSTNPLDRWILARAAELTRDMTAGFEAYELDTATKPLAEFIDDLSTWYLRRSRERFKDATQKKEALATLRCTLFHLAHLIAPAMPFYAENLYLAVKEDTDPESVHLSHWAKGESHDEALLAAMREVRSVVTKALEARNKAGIKVRQPLAKVTVKRAIPDELTSVLREEINVKDVVHDAMLTDDLVLDTELTPALREEGLVRDCIRLVQEARKEAKLSVGDQPAAIVSLGREQVEVLKKYVQEVKKGAHLRGLTFEEGEEGVRIEK